MGNNIQRVVVQVYGCFAIFPYSSTNYIYMCKENALVVCKLWDWGRQEIHRSLKMNSRVAFFTLSVFLSQPVGVLASITCLWVICHRQHRLWKKNFF